MHLRNTYNSIAQQSARRAALPLLVTGVAGVAGLNAFEYFRARYPGQVIGIRRLDNWPLAGEGIEPCNMEDAASLAALFQKHGFRSVLNCEGNCALRACELDPALAWRSNYTGLQNLVGQLKQSAARLVHLSVDLVFSGAAGQQYDEDMPPDPVTVYGKTMVAAERLLLEQYPSACQLRISLPMGISFNGHAGAIDWIQSRFRKHRPATLYFDEVRSPTYTDCLNRVCHEMLAGDVRGVLHAGGPRKLSLYQIAQIVNRVGGYPAELLHGCPRVQAGPVPPRAGNVALDSGRLAAALGYDPFDPWPLDDRYVPDGPAWHYDRPAGEQGSPELLAQVLYRNPSKSESAA